MEFAMRILIIGSPGSGKTSFTKKFAHSLKLPVFHLDDYYWLKNWQRPTPQQWLETLDHLMMGKQWIMDGNYYSSLNKRLEKANYVIYLDYPVLLCLMRALKRTLQRNFLNKDSLPHSIRNDHEYIPKLRINIKFILLMLLFKIRYKKKILGALNKQKIRHTILKSSSQEDSFIIKFSKEWI